jgi:hypothetical protein
MSICRVEDVVELLFPLQVIAQAELRTRKARYRKLFKLK